MSSILESTLADRLQIKFQSLKMEQQKSKLHWSKEEKSLWLPTLFSGSASLYTARTVMPLCAVAISKQLQWSKTDTGIVLSAFYWGYTLTQILGGYLSDRVGGELVLMVATLGWAVLTFTTPVFISWLGTSSTVFYVITLSRVLIGCFQGCHFPAVTSLIACKTPFEEKTFSYSIVTAGMHVGTLLIGCLGSYLLDIYGWPMPFYITGFLGLCWFFFLKYYVVAHDRSKLTVISMRENILLGDKQPPPETSNRVPWRKLFKSSAFWAILIGHFCHAWAFHLILSWLPTYFHENFKDAKGWIFNVVPWLVTFPSVVLGGYVSDLLFKKGFSTTAVRKMIQSVSFLGCTVFLLMMSLTSTFLPALLCLTAAVGCSGLHNSGIVINSTDLAPKYSGSVFGLMNTAGAIPGFIGVYVAGYILEVTQSWTMVFNQTAFICFIGWLVYMIFGSGKKIV